MAHTAEIIAVGDEVLQGTVVNTNAQTLAQTLSDLGIHVGYHTVVGDHPDELRAVLEVARKRADILITTGGLGPTYDDLTKQTLASFFGKKLVLHQDIVDDLRRMFRENFHMEMPENNCRQAELPEGCTVFDNPVGTAPGCGFEADGVHVLMLPGPPHEMKFMLNRHGIPYLKALSQEAIVSHDLMTFGLGESSVEELFHDRMVHTSNPTLATYAKLGEVRLRATARAETEEKAEALLAPVLKEVRETLGDAVYGEDVPGLAEACFRLLKEKHLTFATAESCTGGLIARRFTAIPGASAAYRGGVVSYWTQVKADVLGVPQEILDQYGPVAEPTARAMAEGARRITGADLAVSVTGVAGPDKDERGVDVGTVFVGLATPDGTYCRSLNFGGRRRDRIQIHSANHAFDMMRRYLSGMKL